MAGHRRRGVLTSLLAGTHHALPHFHTISLRSSPEDSGLQPGRPTSTTNLLGQNFKSPPIWIFSRILHRAEKTLRHLRVRTHMGERQCLRSLLWAFGHSRGSYAPGQYVHALRKACACRNVVRLWEEAGDTFLRIWGVFMKLDPLTTEIVNALKATLP